MEKNEKKTFQLIERNLSNIKRRVSAKIKLILLSEFAIPIERKRQRFVESRGSSSSSEIRSFPSPRAVKPGVLFLKTADNVPAAINTYARVNTSRLSPRVKQLEGLPLSLPRVSSRASIAPSSFKPSPPPPRHFFLFFHLLLPILFSPLFPLLLFVSLSSRVMRVPFANDGDTTAMEEEEEEGGGGGGGGGKEGEKEQQEYSRSTFFLSECGVVTFARRYDRNARDVLTGSSELSTSALLSPLREAGDSRSSTVYNVNFPELTRTR